MLEWARFSIADTGRILSILAGYCFISGHVMIIGTRPLPAGPAAVVELMTSSTIFIEIAVLVLHVGHLALSKAAAHPPTTARSA